MLLSALAILPLPLLALFTLAPVVLAAVPSNYTAPKNQPWNFTAISADSSRQSVIECWQTLSPFIPIPNQNVLITAFNTTSTVAYAVFPPHGDAGLHNAMNPQWIVVLSGLARVSIPSPNSNTSYVQSVDIGPGQIALATDTANVSIKGHESTWPTGQPTTSLMLNADFSQIPLHKVLHRGGCTKLETVYS